MRQTGWSMMLGSCLLACAAAANPAQDGAADTPRLRFAQASVDDIAADAGLRALATARARPAYAAHCANCHGAGREGSQARGVPNLLGNSWLWGDATADSELQALLQTITHGIRSGDPKARNIGEMPAYLHNPAQDPAAKLDAAQIDDLTDYVLTLSGRSADPQAAERGRALYAGAPNCFDCHSADGSGNRDWGVPDLTQRDARAWVYGNGRAAIRRSIAEGRKGICPSWAGRIDADDLKALTVWLGAGHAAHP